MAVKTIYIMQFLGTYTICPNVKDIEVDCYGYSHPAQRETYEQEGIPAHAELEQITHNDSDISDYLCEKDWDKLKEMINSKKQDDEL